jgi:3-oxoacyl-[acyl-carrier protein] reductase
MGLLFKDKVVFISGSGSGIGKATAIAFAKEGAKVIINGSNEQKVKQAAQELLHLNYSAETFVGDIADDRVCEELKEFLQRTYGKLDIFVANAGISLKDLFAKTKPEVFRKIVQNNIFSTSSAFFHLYSMLQESKGSFVIVNSVAGLQGLPTSSAYSVSKMALRAFSQAVGAEIKNSGVHLGTIYFGFIQNDEQKTTYTGEGQLVKVPKRGMAVLSKEDAANKILVCCAKRSREMYVSSFTKMMYFLSRLSPALLNYMMRLNLGRMMRAQKLN